MSLGYERLKTGLIDGSLAPNSVFSKAKRSIFGIPKLFACLQLDSNESVLNISVLVKGLHEKVRSIIVEKRSCRVATVGEKLHHVVLALGGNYVLFRSFWFRNGRRFSPCRLPNEDFSKGRLAVLHLFARWFAGRPVSRVLSRAEARRRSFI